jgi:hypothetical protein
MISRLLCLLALVATFLILALPATAQDVSGRIGLSATLQQAGADILLPYRHNARLAVVPGFRFASAADTGTDFGVGLAIRYYLTDSAVSTYAGPRGAFLVNSPSGEDGVADGIVGLAAGAEYFLASRFSIGVEAQFNVGLPAAESARFGSRGERVMNTATLVFASIYL